MHLDSTRLVVSLLTVPCVAVAYVVCVVCRVCVVCYRSSRPVGSAPQQATNVAAGSSMHMNLPFELDVIEGTAACRDSFGFLLRSSVRACVCGVDLQPSSCTKPHR